MKRNEEDGSDQACSASSGKVSKCQESDNGQKMVEFNAHRVIVAARCHWFKCALMSGMKESIDRLVIFMIADDLVMW